MLALLLNVAIYETKQGYGYFCLVLATLFWGGNYLFGKC
ncbi:RhaT protein [Pasteurella canis]|nr:RhaT protein [Pasteurella canis]